MRLFALLLLAACAPEADEAAPVLVENCEWFADPGCEQVEYCQLEAAYDDGAVEVVAASYSVRGVPSYCAEHGCDEAALLTWERACDDDWLAAHPLGGA